MKELHAEWFPIDYPQHFFDRIKNKNILALGCFYKVKLEDHSTQTVMIGTIYSRIERESRKNENVLA